MRQKLTIILLLFFFISCEKEKGQIVTGTVQNFQGCTPGAWLVRIDHPDPNQYSFLCVDNIQATANNCSNSVFITNLPSSLAVAGKKIKFSQWTDHSILCQSYSFAPHHLEVKNVSEVQ